MKILIKNLLLTIPSLLLVATLVYAQNEKTTSKSNQDQLLQYAQQAAQVQEEFEQKKYEHREELKSKVEEEQQTTKMLKHEDSERHLQKSPASLRPKTATHDPDDKIEINLGSTDIFNLLRWIESIYHVSFITGDILEPKGPGKVAGNIISFKTQVPLTKMQAWDLFLTFLDLINMTLVPESYEQDYPIVFRVTPSTDANNAPLPSFVGTNWQELPDNDTKIRFVYFISNGDFNNIFNIVNDLKSKNAVLKRIDPLKGLLLIDKSANVKSLMNIVHELDTVTMPEMMSVLKLKHADAANVRDLFNSLVSTEDKGGVTARLFGVKKVPTAIYFPENTKIIAEERTNALIILGSKEGINKVENFVVTYLDTELSMPYSPLYVYELQYAQASDIANILTAVTKPLGTPASTYGGVRDGDKFFRPMIFTPEPSGNRLLIKAEKDDYLKVRDIIQSLDVKQPQIAIEVLIVNVTVVDSRELGIQMRNKRPDSFSQNISFQNSGIQNPATPNSNVQNPSGIIVDQNGGLMGNLVSLAQGQSPGTTLISIGSNLVGGVWALLKALQTHVDTNVVSHPFLVTTNKYTAQVSLGETRRVLTGRVISTNTADTLDDAQANLTVAITPQINSSGIINLQIKIDINNFTDTNNPNSATRNTKTIATNANVADGEILAIGGLLKNNVADTTSKVPFLGSIPIIGWFFKDRTKIKRKDNLLVFISPRIVEPYTAGGMSPYSEKKADYSRCTMAEMETAADYRDPINRWFFKPTSQYQISKLDDYLNKKHSVAFDDTDPCNHHDDIQYNLISSNPVTINNGYPSVCSPDSGTMAQGAESLIIATPPSGCTTNGCATNNVTETPEVSTTNPKRIVLSSRKKSLTKLVPTDKQEVTT